MVWHNSFPFDLVQALFFKKYLSLVPGGQVEIVLAIIPHSTDQQGVIYEPSSGAERQVYILSTISYLEETIARHMLYLVSGYKEAPEMFWALSFSSVSNLHPPIVSGYEALPRNGYWQPLIALVRSGSTLSDGIKESSKCHSIPNSTLQRPMSSRQPLQVFQRLSKTRQKPDPWDIVP